MTQGEPGFYDPEDDPLGRPPIVVARAPHRTKMDAIRMILADEGVPSLVEKDHEATPPDWTGRGLLSREADRLPGGRYLNSAFF